MTFTATETGQARRNLYLKQIVSIHSNWQTSFTKAEESRTFCPDISGFFVATQGVKTGSETAIA
jgi:hypothetical protein